MDKELLSIKELQELLGIQSTKAYSMVTNKEVECIRVGRLIRIKAKSVEDYMRNNPY